MPRSHVCRQAVIVISLLLLFFTGVFYLNLGRSVIKMKPVSHLSYKLEIQHSVLLLAGIHQNNLSFPNRAIAIHASDQNAFHSAVNFVFYSNTYLYARHTPPTRDKGQQHNEKHSKL